LTNRSDYQAFDTLNHDILLNKLYNYGVRGVVHDWFRNYLTNRQQFTCIAGIQSSVTCVSCGVPQGSVLGPLLFLYINDIGNAVANDTIRFFLRMILISLFFGDNNI